MKILKSRLFIGIICILMAVICIFTGISVQERGNAVKEVLVVSKAVKKGDIITEEAISTKTMGAKNADIYLSDKSLAVSKFALTDLIPGDLIIAEKVADELPSIEGKLLSLDGSRVAISITIKDFARSVSDKVITGDIVSCIVTAENGTAIPRELTYVEVLATTMPSGIDKQGDDAVEENLATATLLVTPLQAELLAEFDKTAEIHLALVYRGEKATADTFLEIQKKILTEPVEPDPQGEVAADE